MSALGGGGNKCVICDKTAYPAETISFEKRSFHFDCFKCTECKKKLEGAKASQYEDKIYCEKCFKTGGFSQKQRSVAWVKKESTGSATSSKFGGGGNPCEICKKNVFPAETVSFEKKCYHQDCFACSLCKTKKSASDMCSFEGALFCSKCFKDHGYNQKQAVVKKTSTGASNALASKFGGGGNECTVCTKTVYSAETVSYEKKPYHQACFKCTKCSKQMANTSDAASFEDNLFCMKCFGDGGYRQKQAHHKTDTTGAAPKVYDNRFSKFGGGGEKCVECKKSVFPAEKISFENHIFHIDCFKCSIPAEDCKKQGKKISVNEAQYVKEPFAIFCKHCFALRPK